MEDGVKIRPIFTCNNCGRHSCTLVVDSCKQLPMHCPFNPKAENQFADWFEMEPKELEEQCSNCGGQGIVSVSLETDDTCGVCKGTGVIK